MVFSLSWHIIDLGTASPSHTSYYVVCTSKDIITHVLYLEFYSHRKVDPNNLGGYSELKLLYQPIHKPHPLPTDPVQIQDKTDQKSGNNVL